MGQYPTIPTRHCERHSLPDRAILLIGKAERTNSPIQPFHFRGPDKTEGRTRGILRDMRLFFPGARFALTRATCLPLTHWWSCAALTPPYSLVSFTAGRRPALRNGGASDLEADLAQALREDIDPDVVCGQSFDARAQHIVMTAALRGDLRSVQMPEACAEQCIPEGIGIGACGNACGESGQAVRLRCCMVATASRPQDGSAPHASTAPVWERRKSRPGSSRGVATCVAPTKAPLTPPRSLRASDSPARPRCRPHRLRCGCHRRV
jgi:hypothetical protein